MNWNLSILNRNPFNFYEKCLDIVPQISFVIHNISFFCLFFLFTFWREKHFSLSIFQWSTLSKIKQAYWNTNKKNKKTFQSFYFKIHFFVIICEICLSIKTVSSADSSEAGTDMRVNKWWPSLSWGRITRESLIYSKWPHYKTLFRTALFINLIL